MNTAILNTRAGMGNNESIEVAYSLKSRQEDIIPRINVILSPLPRFSLPFDVGCGNSRPIYCTIFFIEMTDNGTTLVACMDLSFNAECDRLSKSFAHFSNSIFVTKEWMSKFQPCKMSGL